MCDEKTSQAYPDEHEGLDVIQLLEARLAKSTLFQDSSHVHVIPSTCQPGAAGLFSLGITCALELAPYTGMIEHASNNIMFSFALLFAGLGQLICAIGEYQRKNTFGFTTWLSYSGYWMGSGFMGVLYAGGWFEDAEYPHKGYQMAMILWGFLSILFWLNTFATTLAVNLLFLFLGILFFLQAATVTNPHISTATGVWGIITSALSFYIGMAVLNMEVYGMTYLPLFPLKWDFLMRRSKRKLGVYGTRKDLAGSEEV